jgi:hypothetical protein
LVAAEMVLQVEELDLTEHPPYFQQLLLLVVVLVVVRQIPTVLPEVLVVVEVFLVMVDLETLHQYHHHKETMVLPEHKVLENQVLLIKVAVEVEQVGQVAHLMAMVLLGEPEDLVL